MKQSGILYLLMASALLSSCKSGSFLRQRYTDFHVSHKTSHIPVSKVAKNKTQISTAGMHTIEATPHCLSENPSVTEQQTATKQETHSLKDMSALKIKSKKAGIHASEQLTGRPNKKRTSQQLIRKEKRDGVRSEQGGGLAVGILVCGALSGLILSCVAYFLVVETLSALLLFFLAAPFVLATLLMLLIYHTAGYRQWIVLTHIGVALLIIPAVVVFVFTHLF